MISTDRRTHHSDPSLFQLFSKAGFVCDIWEKIGTYKVVHILVDNMFQSHKIHILNNMVLKQDISYLVNKLIVRL